MKKFLVLAFTFAMFTAPAFAETAAAPAAKPVTPPVAGTTAPSAAAAAVPAVGQAMPGQPAAAPNTVAPAAPVLKREELDDEEIKEVLKDIVIHKHPADFAGAQQLALQNRQERMDMLVKSTECVQKATTVEDLYTCQADERKSLDKIWLSYCDTTVSFLGAKRVGQKNNNPNGNANLAARPKVSECDRAMSAVTGRPPIKQQPDQTDVTP